VLRRRGDGAPNEYWGGDSTVYEGKGTQDDDKKDE